MTKEEKEKKLRQLEEKMEKDESLPLKKGATRLVFGAGNANAKLLCIGEGPGYFEDQKGEPFVGRAGKLLDTLFESIKLSRKNVYITNIVHHRPPSNRDPLPSEIDAYGTYLDKIIKIIEPEIILTLGRFSMAKFLPGVKISQVHGKLYKRNWEGLSFMVVPMYHPAASLRSTAILEEEKEDFLKLPDLVREGRKKPKLVEEKREEKKNTEQMNLI